MPVATAPSLPNFEDSFPRQVANDVHGVEAAGDATIASANASANREAKTNPQGVASSREHERQIKLGQLLVRLGAAKESAVFGSGGLSVPPRDLLVINQYDGSDTAPRPFRWYNPMSWFFSSPTPSPITWSPAEAPASYSAPATVAASAPLSAPVSTPGTDIKRMSRSLPSIDMRPLPDDVQLEPVVDADRTKLLKDEEVIHKTLNGLEDTRKTFLVVSQSLRCENEVEAVLRCYEKYSVPAAGEPEVSGTTSTARSTIGPSVKLSDLSLPPEAGVLKCAPVVSILRQCAEGVATAYSKADDS
ncbi:hypothetical protein ERJ75_001408000 [Trypanosoma vivax]|uniref:Uncharacterized protein n=1 Tax=Trypanosoma vivax (strain Y486) TaxID=1055687 RepID=G0TRS7_TRYVY|nr:hypothetical protein TRVL_04533 [Trypanosoma vivax]KAH8607478.1 hypothetical protein ERJ75_001408000 [Trypanosoma vivax]CCC46649.1 conserved hypothetical protein [Trypanosoma vivax Y486]